MKVFVSYSHRQQDWVGNRLVPCLEAGGAEVLVDWKQFGAGRSVLGQMDATQDQADRHVLVLTADYLASPMCTHEMDRALASDPGFLLGRVVPVRRDDVTVPASITPSLYVDLRGDSQPDPWHKLLAACVADLGATAPDWLRARDEAARFLADNRSVNLVVKGEPRWRELIARLQTDPALKLGVVDLEAGSTAPREGLVAAVLAAVGAARPVPAVPHDLPVLETVLRARGVSRLALLHFGIVLHRPAYGVDLFAALRHLMMTERKLVLLVQSREPVATLLPQDHQFSQIDFTTVELRAAM